MNHLKVSILIPVYKAECYFKECLDSIFSQSYDNIEYVFVNDASPDNCIDILKQTIKSYPKREPRIKIIENKGNKGVAYTRNVLISNATGDFIYFVDSDDFIEQNTIETFVNTAQTENADIVRCNYSKYYNGHSDPVIRNLNYTKEERLARSIANDYGMESLCFLFIRREIITENHLTFPENINGSEDFLMTEKLFYYTNRVVDIPETLYNYRLDNELSITHQEHTFRSHSILAVKKIEEFLTDKGILHLYKEQLLRLMFTSKQHFLLNKKIRDVDKYINTFPESNHCYRLYNYSKKQKILFVLAEHKLPFLIRLISIE